MKKYMFIILAIAVGALFLFSQAYASGQGTSSKNAMEIGSGSYNTGNHGGQNWAKSKKSNTDLGNGAYNTGNYGQSGSGWSKR